MPETIVLPANIDVANARLPEVYERAKVALAECERLDECSEWANQAEALASYARQADDPGLENAARRIRARAVRRCGELLKEIDGRGKNGRAPNFALTRQDVAAEAGLSDHQRITAIRVANVPENEFEAAVESARPPGTTLLAQMGKIARPKVEAVDTLTSEDLSDMLDRHRANEVVNLLLRLAASQCEPQRVLGRLLDDQNIDRLPKVRAALAFAHQLRSALDKAGISEKKPVLAMVPAGGPEGTR